MNKRILCFFLCGCTPTSERLEPVFDANISDVSEAGADATCLPICSGRTCGEDGCGGSCGACTGGSCNAGRCVNGAFVATPPLVKPAATSRFGDSVALSADGTTLVVGDREGAGGNGAVTVYTRSGTVWSAGISLTRPAQASNFGISVSISADGNTLAVGDDIADGTGAVTIFSRSNAAWDGGVAITKPAGALTFGERVALSADGRTLAVGDREAGANGIGVTTVYARTGSAWGSGVALTPPVGAYDFGFALSFSNDGATLAVGDWRGGGDDHGAVAVYTHAGTSWSAGQVLTRPSAAQTFGASVSLSSNGDVLAVGDINGNTTTVFSRNAQTWNAGVAVPVPSGARNFGTRVSLSADGNVLAISDVAGGGDGSGAVTVHTRSGNVWNGGFLPMRPSSASRFGWSVALSADTTTLAVGDSSGDVNGGSVSTYVR